MNDSNQSESSLEELMIKDLEEEEIKENNLSELTEITEIKEIEELQENTVDFEEFEKEIENLSVGEIDNRENKFIKERMSFLNQVKKPVKKTVTNIEIRRGSLSSLKEKLEKSQQQNLNNNKPEKGAIKINRSLNFGQAKQGLMKMFKIPTPIPTTQPPTKASPQLQKNPINRTPGKQVGISGDSKSGDDDNNITPNTDNNNTPTNENNEKTSHPPVKPSSPIKLNLENLIKKNPNFLQEFPKMDRSRSNTNLPKKFSTLKERSNRNSIDEGKITKMFSQDESATENKVSIIPKSGEILNRDSSDINTDENLTEDTKEDNSAEEMKEDDDPINQSSDDISLKD